MSLRLFSASAALLFLAWSALAQTAEVDLGVSGHDTSLPVEVTANSLSVDQGEGTTVFEGDVLVIQGDMRLSARTLRVEYRTGDAARESGRIKRLLAQGNVTIVAGEEAAEAAEAVYEVDTGRITMSGDVLITQGPNALSGERLVLDLAAGTGAMEGRVRTVLQPEPDE